ncbi:protein of unknown function [Xenorhabdus poinarii G6]|uniref:Uncharacterized protein n=1 Tax=Xenorhabdus poinarii G6 TaxID=1354304 RepID=A0A068R363_9GAMM|nr:hypothetical protein [Xenorhabdus poinarii]CDG20570.1 protein of unknown function [Xenorhabdus poinarii G6]
MNEELINSLKNDITNLQTAVHILNDNSKHMVIRSELILASISAMLTTGILDKNTIINFVKSLDFNSHQFDDMPEIVELEKSSVIKILNKVKTLE